MKESFVLGVDLDGVCGDYTAAFGAVVAAERGLDPGELPTDRSWEFAEWGLDEIGGFDRIHRLAVLEHRIFRTMPVMAGAAEALWRLSDAGLWIRIITHRLCVNWGHRVAVADTVAWLDEHAIPYRDICFLGQKPEVEADCYVDDSPDVVAALRGAGNTVVVLDQPYNRDLPGPRARTWTDVETFVLDCAARGGWSLQVQFPGMSEAQARLRSRLEPQRRTSSEAGGRP